MKHFGEVIPEFGELQAFSTSIMELNHQPLNSAYSKSNKVGATEQTLRHAGHRDAINVRVANCTHLLQQSMTPEEVVADAKLWLRIFATKKAHLAAYAKNRSRMTPAKHAQQEKKQKTREQKEERQAVIDDLRRKLGIEDSPSGSDSDEGSSADERQVAPSDQGLMLGRLLKGKMLQLNTNDRKGPLRLQTVGDSE